MCFQHFKVPLVPVHFQLSTAKDVGKGISTDEPLLIGSLEYQDQMEEAVGPKTHRVDDLTVPVLQKKIYAEMDQSRNSDRKQDFRPSNYSKIPFEMASVHLLL